MLEIDFQIILVQIVTFLIGVFILWKIAWKPLTEILLKRKNDISKNITDAQNMKDETEKLKTEYSTMIGEIDKKAKELLEQARISGEQNKDEIISSARDEAKHLLEIAKKQMEEEKQSIRTELRKEITPIAISIAEKVLEKTIDKDAHKKLVEKFLSDLSNKN